MLPKSPDHKPSPSAPYYPVYESSATSARQLRKLVSTDASSRSGLRVALMYFPRCKLRLFSAFCLKVVSPIDFVEQLIRLSFFGDPAMFPENTFARFLAQSPGVQPRKL